MGSINKIEHFIKLKNSEIDIKAKPYPIPYKIYDSLKSEINRLLEMKIIVKSNSVFSNPCFLILKKNKQIRIVTDFRKLNTITFKECFPLPDIQDMLRNLNGYKIFSAIDLNQGFYQIPVHKNDQYKTSFVLPWGSMSIL
ncbi:Transposon Ty3-I Gag-Pol polyprotein [Dictyocoela muelleri]|nr:Transposon Ty3-I Gag-Pol polyprotein [Dictyocoela muelleri]